MTNNYGFYQGRMGRAQLLLRWTPVFAINVWLTTALLLKNTSFYYRDLHVPTIQIIGLLLAIYISSPIVKRLHDFGRSGWQYWLSLVPVYNIYLVALIIFKKGDQGQNAYGDDPLSRA